MTTHTASSHGLADQHQRGDRLGALVRHYRRVVTHLHPLGHGQRLAVASALTGARNRRFLMAQAALETGWGQRMIKTAQGENSFNLFGIKANNGWQGQTAVVDTLEYRGGVAKKEQAKFRAYDSPAHSLQDYVNFISSSSRYQDAVKVTTDAKAYFEQLQAAGYATDPAYAQKIMAVYQSPVMQQVRSEQDDAQENSVGAD